MTELALSFRIGRSSVGAADPVVIHQLFSNGIRSGEEKLMLAVLQDAVECFQANALSEQPWEKKLFQEAENWILEKNTDWFFSFENICETLQLNPGYIRRGLLVWKQAKRNAHSVNNKGLSAEDFAGTGDVSEAFNPTPQMSIGEILTR